MKKLFIFDFGGTLVNANVLNEICGLNGSKEKSIEINKNAKKSEVHDVEALCKRINLMKGITIKEINELLKNGNYLRNGTVELFKWLKENDFVTVVITASIFPVLEYYQNILGIDYIFGSKPRIIDGKIDKIDVNSFANANFKYEWSLKMINELGIDKENVYAIGDTMRDKRMLDLAGHKFVVNPKGGIENYADYIVKEDFREIIEYILNC